MFSESVGQTVRVEKCVSNCGAILETSDKASTLLTDVWGVEGGGGAIFVFRRECLELDHISIKSLHG